MKYVIKGRGGQGVLFLAKVIAETLLLSGVENFSFLKEFDEAQRNGEIIITFTLPFDLADQELSIKEHNMISLREVVEYLNLDKNNVESALTAIKPGAFDKNLKIWQNKE